jgi:hypothetical protein
MTYGGVDITNIHIYFLPLRVKALCVKAKFDGPTNQSLTHLYVDLIKATLNQPEALKARELRAL